MIGVIERFGALGVLLLMVPESACIPVPSEVTLLFSGFAVGEGWMSFPLGAGDQGHFHVLTSPRRGGITARGSCPPNRRQRPMHHNRLQAVPRESDGRAKRQARHCIVGIAVLTSNAPDALEFVPNQVSRTRPVALVLGQRAVLRPSRLLLDRTGRLPATI